MANSTDQALFRYVPHTFRDAASGQSLHPLQRNGTVSAKSGAAWGRTFAASGRSVFDGPAAAPMSSDRGLQTVPLIGSPRDPRFMVS
jgi:hypothetical protein